MSQGLKRPHIPTLACCNRFCRKIQPIFKCSFSFLVARSCPNPQVLGYTHLGKALNGFFGLWDSATSLLT